jgi:antitoxin (DNA-binding transcriptional repressor) of toxin-antitoxin stability system
MRTPKVGIREFRSGLAEFIAAATPVAITRHGHTVAYFIPTSAESEPDLATLKRVSVALEVPAAPGRRASLRKTASKKRVAQVKQNRKHG